MQDGYITNGFLMITVIFPFHLEHFRQQSNLLLLMSKERAGCGHTVLVIFQVYELISSWVKTQTKKWKVKSNADFILSILWLHFIWNAIWKQPISQLFCSSYLLSLVLSFGIQRTYKQTISFGVSFCRKWTGLFDQIRCYLIKRFQILQHCWGRLHQTLNSLLPERLWKQYKMNFISDNRYRENPTPHRLVTEVRRRTYEDDGKCRVP